MFSTSIKPGLAPVLDRWSRRQRLLGVNIWHGNMQIRDPRFPPQLCTAAPQLGNQEVMFLSRIILPWLLETSRDLSAWQVTHCHTYCRAPTVQLLLISESQLSTHSEYNLASKCVLRCERFLFPRCSQPLKPALALQLCCRPTPGHQLVRMLQRCGDCGAVATSYSVTAAEKLGRQKSVATTISSAWASPPSLCIGTLKALTPTLGKKMLAYHLHPPHIWAGPSIVGAWLGPIAGNQCR